MVEKNLFNNSDLDFRVYPEEGVVVCRLLHCADIPIRRILKYSNSQISVSSKYLIDDTYVGIARCATEDTFDEEYGKLLALSKAKRKRGKAINNAIAQYISDTTRDLNILSKYGIHHLPGDEEEC